METSSVKRCCVLGCWAAGVLGCCWGAEEGGCAFALDYFWIRRLSFYKVEDVLNPLLWLAAAGRGVVQKGGLAGKESDPCQVGPGPASVTNVQGSELLTLSHIWDHEAGSRGSFGKCFICSRKWTKNHRSFLQTGLSHEEAGAGFTNVRERETGCLSKRNLLPLEAKGPHWGSG